MTTAQETKRAVSQLAEEIVKCQVDWDYLIRIWIVAGVVTFLLVWLWRYLRRRKQCHACGRAFVDLSAELQRADLLMEERGHKDAYMATAASVLAYLGVRGLIPEEPMSNMPIKRIMEDVAQIIACGRRS